MAKVFLSIKYHADGRNRALIERLCALVLVELSEKGVGLGIEAGYAFARGIAVLAAARAGSDLSMTLAGISARVCLYAREEEVLRIVEDVKNSSASSAL